MKTETKNRRKCSGNRFSFGDQLIKSPFQSKQHIMQSEKLTRWDRITKKHLSSVNVQTTQVRRFFDMNFVSGEQQLEMGGRGDVHGRRRRRTLDPTLVMDMRHEIIRRNRPPPGPNKIKTADTLKTLQLERIRSHHRTLEQKYVDQEIEKFRESLRPPKKTEVVVNLNNYCPTVYDSTTATQCPFETTESEYDMDQLLCDFKTDCNIDDASHTDNRILMELENIDTVRNNSSMWADADVQQIFPEMAPKHASQLSKYGSAGSESEPRKAVRFEQYVQEIKYNNSEAKSDDENYGASIESYSFDDQTSGETIEKKFTEPMQLIGTPLVCGVKSEEIYQKPIVIPSYTQPSSTNSSVLTVTKIDINAERTILTKTNNSMSVTIQPKPTKEEHVEAIEQNEIIADLFRAPKTATPPEDLQLLSKYFLRWIHFTTMEKINFQSDSHNDSRSRKIQQFLNNIRREKKKTSIKDEAKTTGPEPTDFLKRKYNSKLKTQQDIIELQKIKLERQERMITELKLNRLAQDTRLSQANSKQELRNVIRNGNAKARSTARCLQIVGNLREADDTTAADEYAVIQAKGMPKFLVDMQNRALERNARHNEARERREQLERDKEEQRLAAEAAKLKQDEEAKRQRIEELREKRRQERVQRQQQEEERVRQLDNVNKAATFNRKRLLTRYGMDAFHALIKLKRRNQRKMEMFRVFIVLRSAFRSWHETVVRTWAERKRQADALRRQQLLRLGMDCWKKYQAMQQSKFLVAIDWYEMRLVDRMFRSWNGFTRHQKCIEEVKMRQAEAHYNWHLKWRVIEHWQRLRAILQLEKETDERRQKWRLKIWELLPDYQPGDSTGDVLQMVEATDRPVE